MEDHDIEETDHRLEAEVAPALIALHPNQKSVSVAVGSGLRIFSFQHGSAAQLLDENGGHRDSIRAIGYSKSGKLFVSGGDDKLVEVWDTNSWRCVYSVVSEKRVTSLAVSGDDKFVCFSDKFGVVYVVDIGDYAGEKSATVDFSTRRWVSERECGAGRGTAVLGATSRAANRISDRVCKRPRGSSRTHPAVAANVRPAVAELAAIVP